MALEYRPTPNGESYTVRLVECPFCLQDLRDVRPADHIRRCPDAPRDSPLDVESDRQA